MANPISTETKRWLLGMLLIPLLSVIGTWRLIEYRLENIDRAMVQNAADHATIMADAIKYTDTKSPYVFDRGSLSQTLDYLKVSQSRLEASLSLLSRDVDAVRSSMIRLDAKVEELAKPKMN